MTQSELIYCNNIQNVETCSLESCPAVDLHTRTGFSQGTGMHSVYCSLPVQLCIKYTFSTLLALVCVGSSIVVTPNVKVRILWPVHCTQYTCTLTHTTVSKASRHATPAHRCYAKFSCWFVFVNSFSCLCSYFSGIRTIFRISFGFFRIENEGFLGLNSENSRANNPLFNLLEDQQLGLRQCSFIFLFL